MSKPLNLRQLMLVALLLAVAIVMIMVNSVSAQDVSVIDTVEAVPVTEVETWFDNLFKLLLAGLGFVALFMIKSAVTTIARALPAGMSEWFLAMIDDKRQKDLQQAILSTVADIIKSGRWSGNAADFITEIKNNIISSTPQAAKHNNISIANKSNDAALIKLANRKAIEVQATIADTLAKASMAAESVDQITKAVNGDVDITSALKSVIASAQK